MNIRRARRVIPGSLVASLALAGLIAPSAFAADLGQVTATGAAGSTSLSTYTLNSVNVGDTFSVSEATGGEVISVYGPGLMLGFGTCSAPGDCTVPWVVTMQFTVGVTDTDIHIDNRILRLSSAAAATSDSTPEAVPQVSPADVVQGVAMPTSGSCSVVGDRELNWAGVSSGGWASSWAQWANSGRGGPVCLRTLAYSNAVGHWIVR